MAVATGVGPKGNRPTKTIKVKPGKVTDPVWENVIVQIDGDNRDPKSVIQVKGNAKLDHVDLRVRAEFECLTVDMQDIWATQHYAVPVLSSDPDMQQENNHKALSFAMGRVGVKRMMLENNDDCIQLGKNVVFVIEDSHVGLVKPYIGDHRDTFDVDDVKELRIINCDVRGSGNSAIFAKQESPRASLDYLHIEKSKISNYKEEDPEKRQGHMVWLGYNVRRIMLLGNQWDARPVQTLLVTHGTSMVQRDNVYYNAVASKNKRMPGRKPGQPIDVTYFAGV